MMLLSFDPPGLSGLCLGVGSAESRRDDVEIGGERGVGGKNPPQKPSSKFQKISELRNCPDSLKRALHVNRMEAQCRKAGRQGVRGD